MKSTIEEARGASSNVWFAPYVDTTLTPLLHFEDPASQPASAAVLGFIVADPADACMPSWGGYYSLDAAARALDLDRRIVSMRERGGSAVVSFGGAVNNEMAVVCEDVDALTASYQAVIDRYDLKVLDFDIEGAAMADTAANQRRAEAMANLQRVHPTLKIWLTLPVAPDGLPHDAVSLIDETLAAGVNLTGVNVMTMDYGNSRPASMSMRAATEQALNATWQQLSDAYQRTGVMKTEEQVWGLIGATPMIGQNDVPGEVFSIDDAHWLVGFASLKKMGRLSFWSANRDAQCGSGTDNQRVSNTCSSVSQDALEFTRVFMTATNGTSGSAAAEATAVQNAVTPGTGRAGSAGNDDPRTSPYPLWRSAKAYEQGAKIVWQDRVYEAKWYTQGDQPDAPVKNAWETPWRYLGPVLESDREAVKAATTAKDGFRPKWDSERVYIAGDEVELYGKAYRAKWWTQGTEPEQDPDQPYSSPWEYIGDVIVTPTVTPAPGVTPALGLAPPQQGIESSTADVAGVRATSPAGDTATPTATSTKTPVPTVTRTPTPRATRTPWPGEPRYENP